MHFWLHDTNVPSVTSHPSHIDWPFTAQANWFEFKSIMVIDNLYQDGLQEK